MSPNKEEKPHAISMNLDKTSHEIADEQALLKALERLGPTKNTHDHTRASSYSKENNPQFRRRFVQDGDVIVEKQTLRPSRVARNLGDNTEKNTMTRRSSATNHAHFSNGNDQKINDLIQNLKELNSRFSNFEQYIHELEEKLVKTEGKVKILTRQLEELQKDKNNWRNNQKKMRSQSEYNEEEIFIPDEEGQEPVKWWIK